VFNANLGVRFAACVVIGTIAACGGGGGEPGPLASLDSIDTTETGVGGGSPPSSKPSPESGDAGQTSETSAGPAPTGDGSAAPAPAPAPAPSSGGTPTAAGVLGANALSGLAGSGPIVIDGRNGVKITGLRISNPGGPCVIVRGSTDIEISGNAIGPCGSNGVQINDSTRINVTRNNVTDVRNSGIVMVGANTVQVRSNYLDKASTGVRAVRSTGVSVDFNGAHNIRGPFPDGQLAQFDNVHGGGNRIRCNATNLSIGGPDPRTTFSTPHIRTEDIINTWQSNGLSSDPILIAYNRLQGGGSMTGSGIMSGDGGGSWISVIGNRIVNPWNAGVGVAGGSNIRVERNRVFSDLPNNAAGEGYYIRNFYPSACTNITHQNNAIKWPATDWSTNGWVQTYWNTNQCTNVNGTGSNDLNASLTAAIFSEPISECRDLARSMGFDPTGW
jgi:hypothetical protein